MPDPGTTRLPRGTESSESGTNPWHCGYCGRQYVVPSLARDCEWRHEEYE